MKQKIIQILSVVTGLILIGFMIYAGVVVLLNGWRAFTSLTENVQIAISVAFLSLISTVGSIVYTKIKERKLQIEERNNQKKQKLYEEFTGGFLRMINDPSLAVNEDYTNDLKIKFMHNSILWAHPKVLKTYHSFRINSQLEDSNEQIVYDVATLFLEFRKDLGLSNKGISQYTLAEILYDMDQLGAFYKRFPIKQKK